MAAYTLTNEERETILRTDAATDRFEISTADPVYIRRLEKLADAFPDTYQRGKVTKWGEHSYVMPKRLLRFGRPASEARRAANRRNAERLSGIRPFVKHSDLQQDG